MIYSLRGTLLKKTTDSAVISCGGVGFFVMIPTSVYAELPETGKTASLYTYLNVKEDGLELYGFADEAQQQTFRTLLSVSGVGPRVALSVLSVYDPQRVALSVAAGDHKAFTACAGVGPKLAQRIVLELKDKLGGLAGADAAAVSAAQTAQAAGGAYGDAIAALVSLGYGQSEAAAAVSSFAPEMRAEDMIAAALRSFGGR
ncbi:MAG: Holliday junction branch migration protein RuvA [Oscillospiraceae bacterium]|nr:Holliday junction branch migration protein RuvA [Oscillospiraceae bacterium]